MYLVVNKVTGAIFYHNGRDVYKNAYLFTSKKMAENCCEEAKQGVKEDSLYRDPETYGNCIEDDHDLVADNWVVVKIDLPS